MGRGVQRVAVAVVTAPLVASLVAPAPAPAAAAVQATPTDGIDGIGTWDLHHTPVAAPRHLAVPGDGTVWWVNANGTLGQVTPDGAFTTMADPLLTDPVGLAAGDDGGLWVLDRGDDGLELDRVTTTGHVTSVVPDASSWPGPMAVGTDGNLWFVARGETTAVLRWTDPAGVTATVTDPDLGSEAPTSVTAGTGEAVVWIATGLGGVGRVVADPGDPIELLVAAGPPVTALVGDPDGSLWYATAASGPDPVPTLVHLGADGASVARPLPGMGSVTSLAVGPDGHVWATDTAGDRVAHLDGQGELADAVLTVIDHDTFAGPSDLVVGPDGHLWVANTDADTIGLVTVDGLVSRLAPPATFGWIVDVAVGGDGRVWTASADRPGLAWSATDGSMGEVALPGGAHPRALAATGDGAIWFTASDPRVGRVGPDGSVTTWPVPGVGAPSALAPAADGGVWFAVASGAGTVRVAHLAPDGTLGRRLDLPHLGVSGLAEHPDGSVWIVVPGEGVRRWRPDGSVEAPAVEVDRGGEAVVTLDGAVWVADLGREVDSLAPYIDSRLVRIAPSGAIRSVALPPSVTALALAAGPGGDVWWAGAGVSPVRLGKVTAGGIVSLFDTGPERWVASGIAAHPDGTMWVGTSRRRLLHVGADCGDGPFLDVDATHPFCAEVSWLARTGLTEGFPDGTFRPGDPVERQALAAFLWRRHGSPAPDPGPPVFADVPADHPFFDAIQWMGQGGWATGSPDPGGGLPRFAPSEAVTRQAMVTFLWRLDGADPWPGSWSPSFVDVAPGHPFYAAVQWASVSGVAMGTPVPGGGTRFDPGEPISRQAVAALLQRDQLRRVVSVSA